MTRVLMVVDGLWNGGAERQLSLLVSNLPEPWSASVLSMEDGPYRPVLESLGVDVRVVPRRFRFDVSPAARMWKAANDIQPCVVQSWGWMSTVAMVGWCRSHKVPLLNGTIRRGDLPPRRVWAYRLGLALSDMIVANSRAGLSAFGAAGDTRARVGYNGFDPRRFEGVAITNGFEAHENIVAIMAARMFPGKDWRTLFEAARMLVQDAPDWRFVAVGSGPERDALVHEAEDLVASGVVSFPPGGMEVLPMIAAADVGVLLTDPTYHAEGCSNSIMEYMACGLPVVCTDSGGNPELVEDGVTGLLVTPNDVEELVSALRILHDDRVRARAMGREGRRRLEAQFSVEAMVTRFVAAYESLLDRQGSGPK